jgi:hypothetical protein
MAGGFAQAPVAPALQLSLLVAHPSIPKVFGRSFVT